jgi:serine/threonine protein kinase
MDLDPNSMASALPGYVIGEEIGRGGWGSVHRARHVALGRDVAVKQLPSEFAPDRHALERFMSEARIIALLDHPHIVKVYDFVESSGSWLIVMELLDGGTLFEHFREGIRPDQACGVALAMCAALEAAHARGILHRDIKPDNILFTASGVARLSDFGIAKEVDVDVQRTRAGEVIGTPTYMSPEQALGRPVGTASDIYSLGIVLYELLGGRAPFPEAETPMEKLFQHAREAPIPLTETAPSVPQPIADVVMRSLEKDPTVRYSTAQAFGVALAEACRSAFGAGWLERSGTLLMGGGAIEAAALREPTSQGESFRESFNPNAERPVDSDGIALHPPVSGGGTPIGPPSGPPPGTPSGSFPGVPDPSPTPGATAAATNLGWPAPTPTPPPKGKGKGVLIGVVAVLIVLAGVIGAYVIVRASDKATVTAGLPGSSSTVTVPTTDPATSVAPATTVTTVTAPPSSVTTTTNPRSCPGGARCIFIDGVSVQGDSYVITWTAVGFEPSFKDGFFHAHFFWDIYSADQAGTNAKTFGVEMGAWEITDQSPFTAKSEILVSHRPAPANRICVTVGNFAHAVPEPSRFDCFPLPGIS